MKVIISKSENKILSNEQIRFNNFSKKIELLRKKIENSQLKFDTLSNYFLKKVIPTQEAYGNILIEFVKELYAIYKYEKITNVNKEKLKGLMLSNLNNAFQYVVPTEEVKAIYDAFSPNTFDEEEAEQFDMMKEMMEDMARTQFGMDVDFSDIKMNSEDMARKIAEMKDEFEKQQTERKEKQDNRKKTKKELESELKNKQAEELQNKNIRSIYLSLAKMLHPDLETDEILKLEREVLMKKVTVAYQEKDLHTLLKLEIEIIHKQSENLDHLTDDKLRFLNSALKEQVHELEEEFILLKNHPRYQHIFDYIHFSEKNALRDMDLLHNELEEMRVDIAKDTETLKGDQKMSFIIPILKSIDNNKNMRFGNVSEEEMLNFLFDIEPKRGNNKMKPKKRRR